MILAQKYADGGDLLKALHHAGGRLTEHSAVSMVIHPLLACLVYLHGKGIIHRWVPSNVQCCKLQDSGTRVFNMHPACTKLCTCDRPY